MSKTRTGKIYSGTLREQVLASQMGDEVFFVFKTFKCYFSVMVHEFFSIKTFTLDLKPYSDSALTLVLQYSLLKGVFESSMVTNLLLGTVERWKTCGFRPRGFGSWLMGLVDAINLEIGVSYCRLQDASHKRVHGEYVNYSIYCLRKYGETFYQHLGFKTYHQQQDFVDSETARKQVSEFNKNKTNYLRALLQTETPKLLELPMVKFYDV